MSRVGCALRLSHPISIVSQGGAMGHQSCENQPATTPVAAPPIGISMTSEGWRLRAAPCRVGHARSGVRGRGWRIRLGLFQPPRAGGAHRTTGVLYDRAGSGWSDAVAGPRSTAAIVADLHEGLRVAAIDGPYVLVGHSLGGLLVRAIAQHYLGRRRPAWCSSTRPPKDSRWRKEGDEKIVKDFIEQLRANPAPLARVATRGVRRLRQAARAHPGAADRPAHGPRP